MPISTQTEPLTCTPKFLSPDKAISAAQVAREENPHNHPQLQRMPSGTDFGPAEIAVMTDKYWRTNGVTLPVGFLDNPPNDLRAKILAHMNAWGKTANVLFAESKTEPKVRISREPGGYWSYLGTDILLIDSNKQTMNLEGFTMQTADSEFYRVVRHETGHTLGCPHEHMRAELVALIDPAKAIAYYGQTQGWNEAQVRAQVLTPLDPAKLQVSGPGDPNSIMCYQIPGILTKNGQPILGGTDIDATDYSFMGKIYPKPAQQAAQPGAAPLSTVVHHDACPDCIRIDLAKGRSLLVPPAVTEEQLRTVLAVADG